MIKLKRLDSLVCMSSNFSEPPGGDVDWSHPGRLLVRDELHHLAHALHDHVRVAQVAVASHTCSMLRLMLNQLEKLEAAKAA